MWKLIYEDSFGFGEDRDPIRIDAEGIEDSEGFIRLWESVLFESISGTKEKPLKGFAGFTLILTDHLGSKKEMSIDIDLHLKVLADIKNSNNSEFIKSISLNHYNAFLNNNEDRFWEKLINKDFDDI